MDMDGCKVSDTVSINGSTKTVKDKFGMTIWGIKTCSPTDISTSLINLETDVLHIVPQHAPHLCYNFVETGANRKLLEAKYGGILSTGKCKGT